MTVPRPPLAVCVALGILAVTCFLTAIRYVGVAHGDVGMSGTAVEARRPAPPPPAPSAAALPNPASDPGAAIDEVRAARKLGWPVAVGAIVTMLALALGTAGARVPWLAWLGRGVAATVLGVVTACGSSAYDAAIGGGSWMTMVTAAAASLIAFWRAHRPPAPAIELPVPARDPQRGSITGLLALVLSGAAVIGIAGELSSCSGPQRRTTEVLVVDCTIGALASQAGAYQPAIEAAIRTGDWSAVRRIALELGVTTGGCAAAGAVGKLLEPPAPSLTGPSGLDPARLRAGWEQLRGEVLGGRRFVVAEGVL